jgi:chemotaxis protein histidine kinase CheA
MADISCEAFSELDDELKQEFYEDVVAAISDINECVSQLGGSADDGLIDRLFRAIHTVKGNCNMVFLTEFVNSSHQLEDLFSSIRSKTITYHEVYGRFAVQVVNAIQVQLESMIQTNRADGDVLAKLKVLVDEVQNAPESERVNTAEKAITAAEDGHFTISMIVQDGDNGHAFSFMDATDIEFFEFISARHHINPINQRFYQIASVLAEKLNDMLANAVDIDQLRAAVIFLHLTQRLDKSLVKQERDVQSCIVASGLLSRMSGWDVAAELCLQALEKHDGSGLPRALKEDDIMPAAQVISLSFEFALHILSLPELDYKQALFSAVKALNSLKDTHYKDKLIVRFNSLIKSEYLTQKMF